MSARLFLDTNFVIDLLGEREPFYTFAAQLATLADEKKITLVASPLSFATANYILTKYENATIAIEKLRKFKVLCSVCPIDEAIVEKALASTFTDFEDALQYYNALQAQCEIIITRNGKHFKNVQLPVLTAEEFLAR